MLPCEGEVGRWEQTGTRFRHLDPRDRMASGERPQNEDRGSGGLVRYRVIATPKVCIHLHLVRTLLESSFQSWLIHWATLSSLTVRAPNDSSSENMVRNADIEELSDLILCSSLAILDTSLRLSSVDLTETGRTHSAWDTWDADPEGALALSKQLTDGFGRPVKPDGVAVGTCLSCKVGHWKMCIISNCSSFHEPSKLCIRNCRNCHRSSSSRKALPVSRLHFLIFSSASLPDAVANESLLLGQGTFNDTKSWKVIRSTVGRLLSFRFETRCSTAYGIRMSVVPGPRCTPRQAGLVPGSVKGGRVSTLGTSWKGATTARSPRGYFARARSNRGAAHNRKGTLFEIARYQLAAL